jgi:phosphopantothenate-cysteine ligase
MNILITAGGNTEKIDEVRAIRNTGTGRLGALVAEKLALSGGDIRVFYICDRHADEPFASRSFREFWERYGGYDDIGILAEAKDRVSVSYADNVMSLRDEVERVCKAHSIDAVVHSMAVSDYRVKNVTTPEAAATAAAGVAGSEGIAGALTGALADAIAGAPSAVRGSKLSSELDRVLIVMERAPKVISLFRGLAPASTIIGFKLLSDVSEKELIDVGHALLKRNDCDYVLANDMRHIREGNHIGHLIARSGGYTTHDGKESIADAIVGTVMRDSRALE